MTHESRWSNQGRDGGRYCWVGVIIEMAPGQFMKATVRARLATIDMKEEREHAFVDDLMSPLLPVSRTMRLEVEGDLAEYEPTERPEWATEPAQIEAEPLAIRGRA